MCRAIIHRGVIEQLARACARFGIIASINCEGLPGCRSNTIVARICPASRLICFLAKRRAHCTQPRAPGNFFRVIKFAIRELRVQERERERERERESARAREREKDRKERGGKREKKQRARLGQKYASGIKSLETHRRCRNGDRCSFFPESFCMRETDRVNISSREREQRACSSRRLVSSARLFHVARSVFGFFHSDRSRYTALSRRAIAVPTRR